MAVTLPVEAGKPHNKLKARNPTIMHPSMARPAEWHLKPIMLIRVTGKKVMSLQVRG